MSQARAYLQLALVSGLGPISAQRLLAACDQDPRQVFRLTQRDLQHIDGIGPKRAREIVDPQLTQRAQDELDWATPVAGGS